MQFLIFMQITYLLNLITLILTFIAVHNDFCNKTCCFLVSNLHTFSFSFQKS